MFNSGITFTVTVKSGWKKGKICSIICSPASALAVNVYKLYDILDFTERNPFGEVDF